MRRWLLLAPIVLAALWLRTHDLARRPMHADEAQEAVKLGTLLETGRYAFDPRDHHGPTLYYAVLPIAWLRGQHTLAALDETTVRLTTALFGTASVLLLFLLALPLGVWPALAAAAFLAVSPPAVYYSRYFVHETLLGAFTLGAFLCGRAWWRSGKLGWAIAAGVCVGLMQSTKASAPFFLIAALVALGRSGLRPDPADARPILRHALAALAAAIFTAALLYSSFATNPAGLADAFSTYRLMATRLAGGATGHEKPWWYYLQLFGWQRHGGLVFEQVAFSALALAGGVAAFFSPQKILRWAAAYAVLVALLLSVPAYKTPWHAIHLVPALALLAAGALHRFVAPASAGSDNVPAEAGATNLRLATAFTLAALALATLAFQTRLTSFLRPADPRNPYAYVHSSPDVLKCRALADAALARAPTQPIRVISEEYWPLPWYFRGLEKNAGYWSAPPADCDGALVIASAQQAAAVRARLHGRYEESILGLRPGFLCVIFMPAPPEKDGE